MCALGVMLCNQVLFLLLQKGDNIKKYREDVSMKDLRPMASKPFLMHLLVVLLR